MPIVTIELELIKVNNEVAFFKCGKLLSGVIHTTEKDGVTVILDGCYLLGNFHCHSCAIKTIGMLVVKISDGEKVGFGSYRGYKLDYSEKVLRAIH